MRIDPLPLAGIARLAGQAVLEVYRQDFTVRLKADDSPLTQADLASHELIKGALSQLYPDIVIISEEGKDLPYEARKGLKRFWLVDPLDGTKEFVAKNGEFTVNIALVEKRRPVLGVIHVPTLDLTYYGGAGLGSFRVHDGKCELIRARRTKPGQKVVAAVSRSHPDPRLEDYLAKIGNLEKRVAGSAYKFCLLAEGEVNLYARFNPTYEWDTAAGQAILEGAGASLTGLEGEPFLYNKPSLKNPGFIARA